MTFLSKILSSVSAVGLFVAIGASSSQAQEFRGEAYDQLDRTETVLERVQPDFTPLGVHRGSFVFRPSVEVAEEYSDNIFVTDTVQESDFITVIRPNFRVETLNTTPHRLLLDIGSAHGIYKDNTGENYDDYRGRALSRINVNKSIWFDADFTFENAHEDRASENVVQTLAEPLEFDRYASDVSGTYKPGLWGITVGNIWERYDFNNTAQTGGGVVVQDDRDRDEYRFYGEVAYEFAPRYEAFFRTEINTINYERSDFVVGPNTFTGDNRDSKGFDVQGGVRFDVTSILRADLGLGYLSQRYDQASLSDISGLSVSADVAWNVTPLTTLNFNASRDVRETISAGSSGFLDTAVGVGFDHELKRNIIVSSQLEYSRNDFEGSNRQDDIFEFGVRTIYKMNRNLSWVAEYLHDERNSNQPSLDYDRNIFMLRAKFEL